MYNLSSLRKGRNVIYFSGEAATYIAEVGRQMWLCQEQYPRLSFTVKHCQQWHWEHPSGVQRTRREALREDQALSGLSPQQNWKGEGGAAMFLPYTNIPNSPPF